MADTTDWDDDMSGNKDTDDVIELTDIVADDDDDIIELTDVAAPEETPDGMNSAADSEYDIELVSPDEPETILSLDEDDEDDPDFGFETETGESDEKADADTGLPADVQISMEQLETALERVIERKFAEKIDAVLFEVMESVIKKEIDSLKEKLLKDLDQIGNP